MTFSESLRVQWFEVVERWTDARGDREVIVYAGPIQQCGDYVTAKQDRALNIRLASF